MKTRKTIMTKIHSFKLASWSVNTTFRNLFCFWLEDVFTCFQRNIDIWDLLSSVYSKNLIYTERNLFNFTHPTFSATASRSASGSFAKITVLPAASAVRIDSNWNMKQIIHFNLPQWSSNKNHRLGMCEIYAETKDLTLAGNLHSGLFFSGLEKVILGF